MNENRSKQLERDGFALAWRLRFEGFADETKAEESRIEAALQKIMRTHPLYPWIQGQRGVGEGGVGRLLGCVGSLSNFDTVSKLWAYCGMAVRDGRAPKRAKGERSGWSPQARVICYQIGEAIVKGGTGHYRDLYDLKRKEYLDRPRVGPSGCPFGQEHRGMARALDAKTGWSRKTGAGRTVQCVKTDPETGVVSSAHVYAAAKRYAVKMLLKDLWIEWRRVRPTVA